MKRGEIETTCNRTQNALCQNALCMLKGIEFEWTCAKALHAAGRDVVEVSREITSGLIKRASEEECEAEREES